VGRSRQIKFILAILVSLLTFAIYLPALRNGFVEFDDNLYIYDNLHIRSLNMTFLRWSFFAFYAGNWHPLTWISHALDYAVWGLHPIGHHLTSIILHAVNTFLVVLLMTSLLQTRKSPTTRKDAPEFLGERSILISAGITGLLFGVHPLHVESVGWASERKDLLCALFFLLALMTYTKHVSVTEYRATQKSIRSFMFRQYYLLTCGFFILALLSKPMAITLPFVLLILDWFPFKRIWSLKTFCSALIEKLPFIVLTLLSSILTISAQDSGGSIKSVEAIPLATRVIVACKSLIVYLVKLILPLDLVPFYPYPKNTSLFSLDYSIPIVIVIVITAVCIVLANKQKIWLTVWGIYIVTLLPVLGIVQVGDQSMADRYMYLPSLGPLLVLGLTAAWILAKMNSLHRWRLPIKVFACILAVLMCAALSSLTFTQIGIWENDIDLWSYVIRKEPDTVPLAYNNLGLAYDKTGRVERAFEDYNRAIALNPSYYLAYNNRGLAFDKTGQVDKALADFNRAIALNPSYDDAYYNRANVFYKTGLFKESIEDLDRAIGLDPEYYKAYNNRGAVYFTTGQLDKAISDYDKAIALNPSYYQAYYNRGLAFEKAGRFDMAAKDFEEANALQQIQ
jgi:protein O-mannosyl-transferase